MPTDKQLKNLQPWKPGESGNPAGRPIGSRNQFSADLVRDLALSWREYGPEVLTKVARADPSRYLGICASLVPKDVQLSIEQRSPSGLSNEDWQIVMEIMSAVRESLPGADSQPPGAVLSFVRDAIRAHDAQLIEAKPDDESAA